MAGLGERALLDAAEQAGFDLLLTCDQIFATSRILLAGGWPLSFLPTNRWPSLRPVAARVATAVDFVHFQHKLSCTLERSNIRRA
jgi:hypothetical protein